MNNKGLNIGLLITGIVSAVSIIVFGISTFIFQLLDLVIKIK